MKKILIYGMGAFLMAGLWSCKDDVVLNDGPVPEEMNGETGYLTFKIKSSQAGSMTRSWFDKEDYYDKGDEAAGKFADEYDVVPNVQANRVFFFTEDGDFHSTSLLTLEKADGATNDSHTGNDSFYADDEVVYSTTVKRTSDRGTLSWPSQCLVVLNGRPSRLNALIIRAQEDQTFNIDKFLEFVNEDFRDTDADEEGETLGLYKYGGKYYFTMTNSIYWNNGASPAALCNATQINTSDNLEESNLQMTREEAAKHPVTVYVERIMSKVEVGFTGYDGYENGNKIGYFSEDPDKETATDFKWTKFGYLYSFTDKKEESSTWIENDDEGSEDNQEVIKLQALITNWTINAVEYETSLFKNVNFALDKTTTAATWGEQNPFDGWNDFSHHRSYWARDAHYIFDENEYPTQYRKAFEGTARPYQDDWSYGKSEAEEGGNDIFSGNYPWALDYKSFNAVVNKRKYKYCLENTFGLQPNDQEGYKHMIMGSHVLIQARLLTSKEAEGISEAADVDALKISDKYYFSDAYYDETAYINSRVTRMNQVLGENVGTLTVDNLNMWPTDGDGIKEDANKKFNYPNVAGGLWVKGSDGYKKIVAHIDEDDPLKASKILATEVFVIAPAYVAKGDGKVTVALGTKGASGNTYGYGEETVNLYYFPLNTVDASGQPTAPEGKTNEAHQFTRNELVSLIYQVAGTADCFKEGRMYYAVPIQHHLAVGYQTGDGAKKDYEYKYTGLNTADYGVVRNHWYKFTVSTVLKPGIPVHDPTQPIIPNYDDTDRYIGLEVVILPWHVINNGNVSLGDNK